MPEEQKPKEDLKARFPLVGVLSIGKYRPDPDLITRTLWGEQEPRRVAPARPGRPPERK